MGRFISISKAATLVGISVHDLQLEIDDGRLPAVRGMIHLDDLVELHPQASTEQVDMIAWVNKIKDSSLQQAGDRPFHQLSRQELRQLLARANSELAYQRDKIRTYQNLLHELRYSLQMLQKKSSEPNKIDSLIAWIDKKLH